MSSKFTEEELEQIGAYLAEKYPVLKSGQDIYRYSEIKIDIYERIVRVEEELKHQRELIHEVLKMMDKRFEEMRTDTNTRFQEMRTDINARFEQVDKRFNMMMWFTGIGFTLVTTIMSGVFVLLK